MSDKTRKILVTSYIIIMVIVLIGLYFYNNRMVYNPNGVRGNTTGNLNNNGMFCEYDGKIYFANPYDRNRLYVMNSDCSNIKKLNDDTVCSINVYGDYIYYVRNNFSPETTTMIFRGQLLGVIRTDLKGKHTKVLSDNVAGIINLYGNDLLCQTFDNNIGFYFEKISIDGKEKTLLDEADTYPSSIYNNKLYYTNTTDDHNIYDLNLNGSSSSVFLEANAYMVDMQGDYVYYIDMDDGYSLVRVNLATGNKEVLVKDSNGKCISYNLYGNSIFYHIEGDASALYRMNKDGSDKKFIKAGNITNISCTSKYTFFQMYGLETLYRVPTSGGTDVELISIQ